VDALERATSASVRTAKSCVPGIPTLMPSFAGHDPRGDGGKNPVPGEITHKCVPWKGTVLERVQVPPGKGRSGR
jgi:hypothetical protein